MYSGDELHGDDITSPLIRAAFDSRTHANRIAERIRRRGALFGGCRVCGLDHLTTSCPAVAQERRRQEQEERP